MRAKTLIENSAINLPLHESLMEAVRLLNQAIERDPAFALAYYQLAHAHDLIYFAGADHTPARLAMADGAIRSLDRLRPNSGEAHLAIAKHYYWGYLDYDRARVELELAKESLPNDPLPFYTGWLYRPATKSVGSSRLRISSARLNSIRKTLLSSNKFREVMSVCAAMPMPKGSWIAQLRPLLQRQVARLHAGWSSFIGMRIRGPLSSTIQAILAEDPREAENIATFGFSYRCASAISMARIAP